MNCAKVYDVFADEYIDVGDIDPNAPPGRYLLLTEELLIENATQWPLEPPAEEGALDG